MQNSSSWLLRICTLRRRHMLRHIRRRERSANEGGTFTSQFWRNVRQMNTPPLPLRRLHVLRLPAFCAAFCAAAHHRSHVPLSPSLAASPPFRPTIAVTGCLTALTGFSPKRAKEKVRATRTPFALISRSTLSGGRQAYLLPQRRNHYRRKLERWKPIPSHP